MTTPEEQINAIDRGRVFLLELIDPRKTPRIPKDVREQARSILRHYPSPYYTERLEVLCLISE